MELALLVTGTEATTLESAAHARGITIAELLRYLIREYLARPGAIGTRLRRRCAEWWGCPDRPGALGVAGGRPGRGEPLDGAGELVRSGRHGHARVHRAAAAVHRER